MSDGSQTDAGDSGTFALPAAGDEALAEYERLRHRLGFASEPAPLIEGRYRLEQRIGRGAMGQVFLAYDHRLERRIALKLVRAAAHLDPVALQARFEREARALARVDHPNVIGIHDVGTHGGQAFLTMQLVEGETLRQWQADRDRPTREIVDVYLQAARGLAAAHGGGVVHRDFKPDNVMIGADGLVRVLDFGVAAALRPELEAEAEATAIRPVAPVVTEDGSNTDVALVDEAATMTTDERGVTKTGALLGTLPYMAPEQLAGRRADARSDQFGFCVALWEALAGARPFAGRRVEILEASITAGPRRGGDIRRRLRTVLARGLAPDPGSRWPSMDALIDALEAAQRRPQRLAIGAAVVASLLLAGAGGSLLAGESTPDPARVCEVRVAEIDAIWGTEQRLALADLEGADPSALRYASERLDTLAEGWRAAARARCDAGDDDPCLDAWRDAFADHVELLVQLGDGATLARAPDLLARLTPPDGDYCALRPTRPVDPEVWRTSELARSTVALGEIERAVELADAAVARAEQLDAREFSAHAAVAHYARAEVAAFGGQMERAFEELAIAERQALGSSFADVLLPTWTLEAKILALTGGPEQGEAARDLTIRATPLLSALDVPAADARRGDLLEAEGLSARARGEGQDAVALHRRALQVFVSGDRPTFAGKSLLNIGAAYQELDELDRARAAYREAIRLYEAAGLPASYRNRVATEHNLGMLAYMSDDREAQVAGVPHLEFVIEHGGAADRLDAFEVIIALSAELGDDERVASWAARAYDELRAQPDLDLERRVRLQRTIGIAFARAGDPRGEPLLQRAEREADALDPSIQFHLQQSWIRWLERDGRCQEALARRAAWRERMPEDPDPELQASFDAWQSRGPTGSCRP